MPKTLIFTFALLCMFGYVSAPVLALESGLSQAKTLVSSDIIASVNKERLAKGLPLYKENANLSRAAEFKVKSLVELRALEHTQSSNGSLWWPLLKAGYEYSAMGENLAQGIFDPDELVKDWMSSPNHRANIVNPNYTEIGVSVMTGIFNGYSVPYVVLYAGTPKPVLLADGSTKSISIEAQKEIILQKIIELLKLIMQMRAQGLS